jgi:hypothetical protein
MFAGRSVGPALKVQNAEGLWSSTFSRTPMSAGSWSNQPSRNQRCLRGGGSHRGSDHARFSSTWVPRLPRRGLWWCGRRRAVTDPLENNVNTPGARRRGWRRRRRQARRCATAAFFEIDNVRAAMDWAFSTTGDASIGAALTAGSIPLWFQMSLLPPGLRRTRGAQSRGPGSRRVLIRRRLARQVGWHQALWRN